MSPFTDAFDSLHCIFATVFQEVLILTIFAVSFFFCKYVRRSHLVPVPVVKACPADPLPRSAWAQRSSDSPPTSAPRAVDRQQVCQAESQIMRLLKANEFTSALKAYRTFERQDIHRHFTNEAMFNGFIQSAVRMGKLDVLERMMQQMMQNRVSLSVEFWHSTLKLLLSRKQFSACLTIYKNYGRDIPDDKVVFSCLINAALEGGSPEQAVSMLERFKTCGLEQSDFVSVFRTYVAAGQADKAVELFRELKTKATPLMFNLVLTAMVKSNRAEDAMDLVLEAHSYEGAARSLSMDDTSASSGLRIVDAVSYNIIIKGFVATRDGSRCFECLRIMQSHNLQADDVTLTSLLDISLAADTHAPINLLVELLMGRGNAVEIRTCNAFIKALIRHGSQSSHSSRLLMHKAAEIYEALKTNGPQPSIATYSLIIKGWVYTHNLERALQVVEDLTSAGEAPDEIIFTQLLEGCHHIGNSTLGERIFADMLASKVRPSEYTLTTLLKLYGRVGLHEKAYELLANWECAHGAKPSVIHYTCLMSGCLLNKCPDQKYGIGSPAAEQAWAVFKLMERQGVALDETMVSTLMPAMVNSKKYDCVLHLAKRVLHNLKGFPMPHTMRHDGVSSINRALAQMATVPNAAQELQEIKSLMQVADFTVRHART